MAGFQVICRLDQIPDRSGRTFVVDEQRIGVFRVDDEVFALDDHCPHAGASLARGYLEGDVVRCRIHHWGFRLRDGVYVDADSPCHNAKSIPTRVRDGQVEVWVGD